jgi:hypothetical protein
VQKRRLDDNAATAADGTYTVTGTAEGSDPRQR